MKLDRFITNNQELQELAVEAQENWLFDEDTDPVGKVAEGLGIIRGGDVADDEVADVFQIANFPKSYDKWDALEDWAKRLAGSYYGELHAERVGLYERC